jgi:hypothetical protein
MGHLNDSLATVVRDGRGYGLFTATTQRAQRTRYVVGSPVRDLSPGGMTWRKLGVRCAVAVKEFSVPKGS